MLRTLRQALEPWCKESGFQAPAAARGPLPQPRAWLKRMDACRAKRNSNVQTWCFVTSFRNALDFPIALDPLDNADLVVYSAKRHHERLARVAQG